MKYKNKLYMDNGKDMFRLDVANIKASKNFKIVWLKSIDNWKCISILN
ncbi:hypothetical protein [Clostridium hydrogenum]|nr:hypothetical protein [Clostridium hydrogenum]